MPPVPQAQLLLCPPVAAVCVRQPGGTSTAHGWPCAAAHQLRHSWRRRCCSQAANAMHCCSRSYTTPMLLLLHTCCCRPHAVAAVLLLLLTCSCIHAAAAPHGLPPPGLQRGMKCMRIILYCLPRTVTCMLDHCRRTRGTSTAGWQQRQTRRHASSNPSPSAVRASPASPLHNVPPHLP